MKIFNSTFCNTIANRVMNVQMSVALSVHLFVHNVFMCKRAPENITINNDHGKSIDAYID
jgi:hypothetical protein